MAVYVDDMYTISLGNFRNMKMSHMAADTHDELLEMARKIGLSEKWIQNAGFKDEHFDVSISKRILAIQCGAIPISMRTLCPAIVRRSSYNEKLIFET